ncbi:MAG TPA: hypothetical protein VGE06_03120, partial [Flavisolibacter sp.]
VPNGKGGYVRVDAASAERDNPTLFTTDDGVEIRKGDFFYMLNATTPSSVSPNNRIKAGSGTRKDSSAVYFSTSEAAEAYFINNVRILTLQQVMDVVKLTKAQYTKLSDAVRARYSELPSRKAETK